MTSTTAAGPISRVSGTCSAVLPPRGSRRLGIAYKTGTSYGYRDAWSVGYDGRHVLGVWVGRADNAAVPGLTGYESAAPILFEAFAKSGIVTTPMPKAPPGAVRIAQSELPVGLRRFARTASGLVAATALLRFNPQPTEADVRWYLAGNLCRCTGYDKIIRAVFDAAERQHAAERSPAGRG